MISTTTSTTSDRSHPHRSGRVAAAVVGAGLALTLTACASGGSAGSAETTSVPATRAPSSAAAPPTTVAERTPVVPPTTVAERTPVVPPTTAPTVVPAPTTTQPDEARRALLNGILDGHRAAGEFVGARIALRGRDGAVIEASAGTQTTDPASLPVDLDAAWNIGSLTKTFVAVVVLQLADEGRVDLDEPIAGVVPDLAGADRITPRMLLQHTSGLNEYKEHPAVQGDAQRAWTPAELISVAEGAGRVGEPGGPFQYANTNYLVLGQLVEAVTGNSWSEEVRTRITEPLGMTSAGVTEEQGTAAYAVADGAFVDRTTLEHPSIGGAAGGMASTGRDLLRFGTALFDGTLLSPESQVAMQTFVPGLDLSAYGLTHAYGLGLEQYTSDAVVVIGHLGNGAQSSFLGFDPEHGTLVAVTSNTANPESTAIMALETLAAVADDR